MICKQVYMHKKAWTNKTYQPVGSFALLNRHGRVKKILQFCLFKQQIVSESKVVNMSCLIISVGIILFIENLRQILKSSENVKQGS